MTVLGGRSGPDDSGSRPGYPRPDDAVDARVSAMLSSPEELVEGIARTDAGDLAGPDGDARFARFLADQPDRELASLGRALLRGERPGDLLASHEFGSLLRDGVDRLEHTDGRAMVRVVAENDRALRRD